MNKNITKKEKEMLIKYYSLGISIEALAIATGFSIENIKKVLGINK